MGRGAYDTTGTPKPCPPRPAIAAGLSAGLAHKAPVTPQAPILKNPQRLDSLPGPMDAEPSICADADQDEAAQDETSATDAVRPQLTENMDLDSSAQAFIDSGEDDSKGSRPPRFTDEQKLPLEQWMTNNKSSPYPTLAEKEQLAQATGLSTKQIQQYCTNYRRRNLEKFIANRVASVSSLQNAQESSSRSGDIEMRPAVEGDGPEVNSPTSIDEDELGASVEVRPPSRHSNRSSHSPYLGQRNSPEVQNEEKQDENIVTPSLSASNESLRDWWLRVHFNVTPGPQQSEDIPDIGPTHSLLAGTVSLMSAPLERSVTTRYSADDVQSTAGSIPSTRGSRRGRKAYGNLLKQRQSVPNFTAAHVCEQCGNAFQRGSTLKRHIQSVHETNQRWVCGPVVKTGGSLLCPTCLQDPLDCGHGMLACWERSEEERTFYRKDLLKQHLKLVHEFGSGLVAEDGNTLTALGVQPTQEKGLDSTLRRIGAQVLKGKRFCYEWSSQEHSLSRRMFDPCWAEALSRVFGLARDAISTPESVNRDVTNRCFDWLRGLIDSSDADGKG